MSKPETLNIADGRGNLSLTLPRAAEITVIRKNKLTRVPDQNRAVTDAFANLFECAPLPHFGAGQKKRQRIDLRHHASLCRTISS